MVKAKRASLAPLSGPSSVSPDVQAAREASAAISPPCSATLRRGTVEDAEVLVVEIALLPLGFRVVHGAYRQTLNCNYVRFISPKPNLYSPAEIPRSLPRRHLTPCVQIEAEMAALALVRTLQDCPACAAYVMLRVTVTSIAQAEHPDMQKTEVVNHPVVSLAVSTPISSSFLHLTFYRLCYEFGLTSDLWVPPPPPVTRPPLTPATNQPHTKNMAFFFLERFLFNTYFLDSELPSPGPASATGHAEADDDYGFVDPPATSAAAAVVEAEPAIVRVKSGVKGRRVSLMNFDSQVILLRVSCGV